MKTYTTVQGDMWDAVSYKVFGDVSYTDKIMSLNYQFHDTYIFPAGVDLQLPERAEKAASSLPPWKRVGI